ncbi:MAG: Rpn family recombination-promoting nuclease/putative transposase [Bacteroidia bacterium]
MPNPHDTYFRHSFSNSEIARDFLVHFVKDDIVPLLDLDTLTLSETSYVDESLQSHFSDVVYTCLLKHEEVNISVTISLLLEHKSYIDHNIHLQLLRYQLNAWEHQQKETPTGDLQPIIPIVIYHGEKHWEQRKFVDRFGGIPPILKSFIPEVHYIFRHLNQWSTASIVALQTGWIRNAVLALIHGRNPEAVVQHIADILNLTPQKQSSGFLRTTILYLFTVNDVNTTAIMDTLDKLPQTVQRSTMTIADQFRAEGREEGRQEGRQEGRFQIQLKTTKKIKKMGLSNSEIASATELTVEQIEQICRENNL